MSQIYYYLCFALYALFMISIGFYIYRKEKKKVAHEPNENAQYWCANRTLPFWQMGISLAAGWMMLGWIGLGIQQIYMQGLSGLWVLPIPWFLLIFLILLIIPYIRRLRAISIPRALMHRFGKPTAILVGICSLFIFISWMGAELFMAGNLLSRFLNTSPQICMILFVTPILFYMVLGGFRAIILTDLIQFILMIGFISILTIVAISLASDAAPQGNVIDTLAQTPTQSYGENTIFSLFACGRILPIILLIAYLPGWLFEQDLVVRIFACKSLKESYKGIAFGGAVHIIFTLICPTIIAFCAILIFPYGESESLIGADALQIIPAMIEKGCAPMVQLLMFLGIIAVQMSTIDSFANVSAMAISHDIADPLLPPTQTPLQQLSRLRLFSILTIIIGLIYGFFAESLYDLYTLSSGVLTASVAIPLILLFIPKAKPLSALLSSLFGLIGNILFFILEYHIFQNDYQPAWLAETYIGYIVVGIIGAIIGIIIGQIFGQKSTKNQLESVAEQPHDGIEKII